MATLLNPSSSSSPGNSRQSIYDTSATPPPIHGGGGSGLDNETGSDASSPAPPLTSQGAGSSRDFDPSGSGQLSDSPSATPYLTPAAAAAAAAASSASTSSATDETAQFEADKRKIYKHPLFPLLALLFEKCELATQSSEVPSTESFNLDIQAFVQHQGREGKPFFTDNQEINDLMIKAIQVLRIHLLELEKVQELCKDFCNRYITCLKGKMQSENLLRSDYGGYDSDDSGSGGAGQLPPGVGPSRGMMGGHPPHPAMAAQNQAAAAAAAAAAMYYHHPVAAHHNATISTSGTLLGPPPLINNFNIGEDPVTTSNLATTSMYQHHFKEPSSQQPQSPNMHHNAEPSSPSLLSYKPSQVPSQHRQSFELIQRQKEMEQQKLIDQIQDYSNLNIDGSTPLSAIASRPFPKPPSQDDAMPTWLTAALDEMDDNKQNLPTKKGILPRQATNVMRSWLFQHIVHPYPTEDEKKLIADQTNLSVLQVNNWFINARRRILQPMMEPNNGIASKPVLTGPAADDFGMLKTNGDQ